MNGYYHALYIVASAICAIVAVSGIIADVPMVYGIIPGVIGGIMFVISAVRFFKHKADLAGFVANLCGFVYYQAYQANPVMLPDFTAYVLPIPKQDQVLGIALANLTVAMLLGAYQAVSGPLGSLMDGFVPTPAAATRERIDRGMVFAFWILFILVAAPNVLFGKVVVGSYRSIVYQRLAWSEEDEFAGYEIWGGPLGHSVVNMALWASSLYLLWLYLLRSKHRVVMYVLSPLVLLWTAGVVMQGTRTYLVTMAVATAIYLLGDSKSGAKAFYHALWSIPLLFVMLQVSTLFRAEGLKSVNAPELASRILEVSGNEGATDEMDGIEFFRTEVAARGTAPGPALGFVRGLVERPIEGLMMPIPRTLFPLKPYDKTGEEYNLFFENVRLGMNTSEVFMGASPGLIGRELIKYGYLGPITLLIWMGLILGLADRLYSVGSPSDFHRIFAAALLAFFVAQARDFAPVWFIPFLPAMIIFMYLARNVKRISPSAAPVRGTAP
jgi:hypothetical protein